MTALTTAYPPASLEPEETSVSAPPPDTYAEYKTSHLNAEYQAGYQLYQHLNPSPNNITLHRYENCGHSAWFVRHRQTGEVRVSSNKCHLRWCPLCALLRRNYLRKSLLDWLVATTTYRFLTVTLRHSQAPLTHQIQHLYKSWRKLRLHPRFARLCTGGIWMFEVKKSRSDNLWHPHIHALITGDYIPQRLISNLWAHITIGSKIVDIRTAHDHKQAARYISKYATKPADLSAYAIDEKVEIYVALHGRRLCGTWGTARSIQLTPKPDGKLEDWEEVGTWHDVVTTIATNPVAAAIWRAYTTGRPLLSSVSLTLNATLRDLADNVHGPPIPYPDLPPF